MSASRLDGTTVVVVGGASGIGLAVARGGRERGAHAAVLDIDSERLAEAEREGLETRSADVSDEPSLASFFESLERVDHVYVAAGSTRLGDLHTDPLDVQLAPLVLRVWGSARVSKPRDGRVP
ncbi:MAG: SDR family NAD(P)-dependent oxidoreductase [Myxococcales bacterium]|nr:SDR family NAD(P)-dependent oxidoreductase [Myxococcales bacterium]